MTKTLLSFAALVLLSLVAAAQTTAPAPPKVSGCQVFPSSNVWNTPIDTLPVHSSSAQWVASIGATKGMHADFDAVGDGIPYLVVSATQPKATVTFQYPD